MIAIYDKGDLVKHAENKKIRDIELTDIRFSMKPIQLASAVIYVDQVAGLMRVLKYRWNSNIDSNAVFDSKELPGVLADAFIEGNKGLGKSTLLPGSKKRRGQK